MINVYLEEGLREREKKKANSSDDQGNKKCMLSLNESTATNVAG